MRLIFLSLFSVISGVVGGWEQQQQQQQQQQRQQPHEFYPLPRAQQFIGPHYAPPPIERQLSFSPSDASNRIRLTLYLSKLANRFGRDPEQHQGMQGELPQASDIAFDVKQRGGNGRYAGVRRGQRRRPPRTRARPQAWLRRNSNCACSNLFSCLLRGGRLEPDQSRGGGDGTRRSCPGVAEVCCSAPQPYNPFSTFLSRQFRKPARAWKGRRRKSRRLTRLPPVSYSGAKAVKLPTSLAGQQALYASNFIEDPEDYTCGVSRHVQRRILGGLDAGYGQFPWTAHIQIHGPDIDKECGGTLIHRRWVLTAGHCTQYCIDIPQCLQEVPQSRLLYQVSLGEYDQLLREKFPTEKYRVDTIVRHPQYTNVMRLRPVDGLLESEPRYDVAMIRLARDVTLAPSISPICLPAPGIEPPPGTEATVVGWGRLGRLDGEPHSNVLQAATVPLLSDDKCLAETGLPNGEDQICAGSSDAAACPGDSGGALQVQDTEGRWTVVGVVSNGPSVCGAQPVIFHKVAHTMQWINQVIEEMRPVEAVP